MQQHPEDMMPEKPKMRTQSVTVRVRERERVAVTYATLCICRRLLLNKMPKHNALCYVVLLAK